MFTFCQRLYHRKCQRRGVGGQKSQNLVNVVCERPLNDIFPAFNVSNSNICTYLHMYLAFMAFMVGVCIINRQC